MASPSRRRTSPSGKRTSPNASRENLNAHGLEMKFDWLANRVEKLGELQRQASVETISASDQMITTPGGSRIKESDLLIRELQSLTAKVDALSTSFHKQQLDLSRVESRQFVGFALAGAACVCAAFLAGATRR